MVVLIALAYGLGYVTLGLMVWASISAIRRPADRYPNRMRKSVWVVVLVVTVAAQAVLTLVWAFPFPSGFVAAWCYLIFVALPARRRRPSPSVATRGENERPFSSN